MAELLAFGSLLYQVSLKSTRASIRNVKGFVADRFLFRVSMSGSAVKTSGEALSASVT